MLIITQRAYSYKVAECDLDLLRENVRVHLESIQQKFGVELLSKHHNLTHYARVIRAMGPLPLLSTFRYESKNKSIKEIANRSRNFININKTIAMEHQKLMTTQIDSYKDIYTHGVEINTAATDVRHIFGSEHLPDPIERFVSEETIIEVKWFRMNDWTYRKGLIVLKNAIYEIVRIFTRNGDYLLLVKRYIAVSYHKNLNSVRIVEYCPIAHELLIFSALENRAVHEKKLCNGDFYLIIDSLETKNCLGFG